MEVQVVPSGATLKINTYDKWLIALSYSRLLEEKGRR